jgi:DNA polymerase I-like protein with 3'-5' exonuclease and polymerase domains
MGEEALALRIKQPVIRAKQLLGIHRKIYSTFWNWSDNFYNHTVSSNQVTTLYGWKLQISSHPNPRSLRNFPMQANAAELLRIACILMVDNGITLCAPVHDAVLIEALEHRIDEDVAIAQACMELASQKVLTNFTLHSEAEILIHPRRFLDASSEEFWDRVMAILQNQKTEVLQELTPTC